MSAVTKRVVMFTLGLTVLGAVSASARPFHGAVHPRVVVHSPFVYDPFWGPWGPYTYGYPYSYSAYPQQASIRTEVKPKDAEVYVDGYYAGRVSDFDGALQRLHVTPGGHSITFHLDGFRTVTQDVYVRPDSTLKMSDSMLPLAPGQNSAPVPAAKQG